MLLGTASIATLGSIASFGMLATNPMTGFTQHGWEQALLRDGHGVSRKALKKLWELILKALSK